MRICDNCPLKSRSLCRRVMDCTALPGLVKTRRVRVIQAETRLQEENERPQFVGILRKGYLRTERMLQDGRRTVLSFFTPGDLIGDVIGSVQGPALIAATDAEICSLDPCALRRALQEDARLHADVVAEAMKQTVRQLEMVWRRGVLDSRERIVAFMILATEFMPVEPLPDGSLILSIKVSRKDWADFSNTTVETISRTLTYLAERRLVETVAPGRYRIRDIDILARLAGLDAGEDRSAMLIEAAPCSRLRSGGNVPLPRANLLHREDLSTADRSAWTLGQAPIQTLAGRPNARPAG